MKNSIGGFFSRRKMMYGIAILLVAVSIAISFFITPNWGEELRSHTTVTYSYTGEMDIAKLQTDLKEATGNSVRVDKGFSSDYSNAYLFVSFPQLVSEDTINQTQDVFTNQYSDNIVTQLRINSYRSGFSTSDSVRAIIIALVAIIVASLAISLFSGRIPFLASFVGLLGAILLPPAVLFAIGTLCRIDITFSFMAATFASAGLSAVIATFAMGSIHLQKTRHDELTGDKLYNKVFTAQANAAIISLAMVALATIAMVIVTFLAGSIAFLQIGLCLLIGSALAVLSAFSIAGPLFVAALPAPSTNKKAKKK